MRISPWVLAFISWPHAFAVLPCPPLKNQITAPREVAERTLRAAQIGTADRQTADAFGAASQPPLPGTVVERRYAASGDVVCADGAMGQAQIVVSNDTIVTSAHGFDAKVDCKGIKSIQSCQFHTYVDGVDKTYNLKSLAGTGHKCPRPKGTKPFETAAEDDWIVLKLAEATDPRIKPYKLPAGGNVAVKDQKVVAVGKSEDWPPGAKGTLHERPRHYADCEAKDIYTNIKRGAVQTTCDMGDGASGGAMLTPGEDPVLLGIARGVTDAAKVPGCDANKYKGGTGDYDPKCWGGTYTMMTGDLQQAITKATSAPATPLPSRAPEPASPRSSPNVPKPEGFKLPKLHL